MYLLKHLLLQILDNILCLYSTKICSRLGTRAVLITRGQEVLEILLKKKEKRIKNTLNLKKMFFYVV